MTAVLSDPVMETIKRRRDYLAAEGRRIEKALKAYWSRFRCEVPLEPKPMIPATEHYKVTDTGEGSDCGCPICTEWRQRRQEFLAALPLIPKNHQWSICACKVCRFVGRVQLNLTAASNKRDLYIAVSFHANYSSPHGDLIMKWLEQDLKSERYTPNWCAQELNRFPVERWLARCQSALSGRVSGDVFSGPVGEFDFLAWGASSLADSSLHVAPHFSEYG